MSTFKNKNSLRTIEAKIVQELKNNEARPKCTGSYKKKRVFRYRFKYFTIPSGGPLWRTHPALYCLRACVKNACHNIKEFDFSL